MRNNNTFENSYYPYFYLVYRFRKTIPNDPTLFYLFIAIKFLSVYLITHNITETENHFLSLSSVLNRIRISSAQDIEYSILSVIIFCVLMITILILIFFILLIKKAQKVSDCSIFKIQSSKIVFSSQNKLLLKSFIYFYCAIAFFSHFIIEHLCYCFLFLFPHTSNSIFNEKHLIALNNFQAKAILNKYLLCIINSIGIIIIFILSYFFILFSSYRTITTSYGVQVNTTHKRVIAMLIIFHLHCAYSFSDFFILNFQRQFRFWICIVMMFLLLTILLLHYHVYNISTSRFGSVICFFCDWCLISSIIEVIIYIGGIKLLTPSFYFMKSGFEIANAILFTVGIIAKNKSNALFDFQKCLFSNHKLGSLNNSLIEYFILVQKSSKDKFCFVWFYDFIINHRQYCFNENCQCQKNPSLNSISPQTEPECLLKLLTLIGEELIESSVNRPAPSQIPIIEEYYLLHVDFLISIKKKYFLSLYLCQYYLNQKSEYIGFLFGYYLFEMNRLIFSKFKGKLLDHSELNKQISNNQKKMIEQINKPENFLLKQFKIEKIRQMIYNCIFTFEKLMDYRYMINNKKKISVSKEEFLSPLHLLLNTRKLLLQFLTKYVQNKEFSTAEIYFIIAYAINYLYDSKPKQMFENFIPNINDYQIDFTTFESQNNNYLIIFLEPDEKFRVRYASINLIEKLLYKQKEFIGMDFNELLPNQIRIEHFVEMKKLFINENTKYKKNSFFLTKNMNISLVYIKGHNLPTLSHYFAMVFDIVHKNNHKKDLIYYNLLLDDNFKFISSTLNFEKLFNFSIKMLEILKIDFCQLFGLNMEILKNRFQSFITSKKEALNKESTADCSLLTLKKQEHYHLYSYLNNNKENKRLKEKTMIVKEIVSKNKTLNEIKKIDYNIQELEKEWKERIADLYNRLKTKKGIDSNENLHQKNLNFYIRIELKSIGFLFYYIVLIKEEILSTDLHLNQYSENDASPISQPLCLKSSSIYKNNFQLKSTSFFNTTNKTNNLISNKKKKETMQTPIAITTNMNNLSSSIPNSSLLMNYSNSKIGLVSHEIKLLQLSQKKHASAKIQEGTNNKSNNYSQVSQIERFLQIINFLDYSFFLIVFVLIIFNFTYNKVTTQFSIDLFNVNIYSFLVKADIYFSSLGAITTCLIKDGIRKGDLFSFSNRVKIRAQDLLIHYNQLLYNINSIVNHFQANELYTLFYSEDRYDLLGKDWNYYQRMSSFGEEVYYMHMSLLQFDLLQEGSVCRIRNKFYKQKFTSSTLIETEEQNPSFEEKFLFFISYNVISKLSRKMDFITIKINQIVQQYNDKAKYVVNFLNWIIFSLVMILYMFLIATIFLFHFKFRYEMIKLFERKPYDDLFRFQISLFRKLIEDYGQIESKLFEEIIQSKTIAIDEVNKDTQSLFKKLSNNNLNEKQDFKSFSITSNDVPRNEDHFNPHKDFNKIATLHKGKLLLILNCFFFVCFIIIQISNIILKQMFFSNLMIQNDFAINYLSRIPKFGELELYAIISVIFNDMNYITTEYDDYKTVVLANYYQVQLDMKSDSLFQTLGNSHFAFIYYQLFITRRNIQLLTYDRTNAAILKQTKRLEILFNTQNQFCISMPFYFAFDLYKGILTNTTTFFNYMSSLMKECREASNGINLSGSKASADLVIRQLCDLFAEHFQIDSIKRDPDLFFLHSNYLLIDENVQFPLKKLHNVNSNVINEEIKMYYDQNQILEISFSILILLSSCGFILFLFYIVKTKIKKNCDIIVDINKLLESVLMNIQA